jgi:hypothetical protein
MTSTIVEPSMPSVIAAAGLGAQDGNRLAGRLAVAIRR